MFWDAICVFVVVAVAASAAVVIVARPDNNMSLHHFGDAT